MCWHLRRSARAESPASRSNRTYYAAVKTDQDQEVSIEDIDEALQYLSVELRTDEYCKRMTWKRRKMLVESIDDLLDLRLQMTVK